jgi:F-type H+-transporting ATPase subunit O
MFKKDPKLGVILNAPTLSLQEKSQIVEEIQKHTGITDKGDTVRNFLKTLAENNRLGILHDVCEKFVTLTGAAKGEIDLIVTSAAVSFEISSSLVPFVAALHLQLLKSIYV